MQTIPIQLQQSQLLQDYRDRKESIFSQFDYDPYQLRSYKKRLSQLQQGDYQREELAKILLKQNRKWGAGPAVEKNIETLKNPNSSVVIGGQQAGILTGPLYTIHKMISILVHAKEQEEHLQQPVIPVFWIAGEDHDFEEINHIYIQKNPNRLKKVAIDGELESKQSVSSIKLPKKEAAIFLENIFSTFQETKHTKKIYNQLKETAEQSDTYVDFFGTLTHQMFQEEGLVLVDSDDSDLRKLESSYFVRMIEEQPNIAKAVVRDLQHQEDKGYTISIDAESDDGHLFYHVDGERQLLMRENDKWKTKDGHVSLRTEELLEIAKKEPELLSNNVITRPLMQELVFPVLAFHAGPGELAYWSILKNAFRCLDLTLPIVMPRLSMTLLQSNHQSWIDGMDLSIESLIQSGVYTQKMNWLNRQTKLPIEETFQEVQKHIETVHQPIQEIAESISSDMEGLSKKNLEKIQKELAYVEKRFMRTVESNHQLRIKRYDTLDTYYHPDGGLQERKWNLIYWMNQYGWDLPSRLTTIPPKWEVDHLIVNL
ncbi:MULTISPECIES: bacillithiol biosynthesis cysteine-adding enzyme BshC [Allobacillus]|uniref:Putative cysteine ligase BshC n=1 Tax=Allobacillus salarius TaxID=1955272 RepID=A0A556PRP0_9BACI|nr:bacillithiol biosynthesis cysteine-adding enzyme BshC [Allobacillus salarius]TSJ67058.1 bacillithiol biosynthesis cysteine-adding enzyme BshC [Allobacillus salarius]